ncbi:MAG: helix-turn-helix domain-containing protein [Actinomycetota bacterium]|nr:helix-turn-helix domain-containing protein [Actinomycetota bacterium]
MLDAVDRGVPRREVVVGVFGVSLATLKRWLKRRKEGEDLGPKPSPGRTPTILATAEEKRALWEQLWRPTTRPPWSATASCGKKRSGA